MDASPSPTFGERDTLVFEYSAWTVKVCPSRLASGRVLAQWPELKTSRQGSSIIRHLPPSPPFAVDPVGRRFAVATDKGVEVVRIIPE